MHRAKLYIRLSAAGRHASAAVLFLVLGAVGIWGSGWFATATLVALLAAGRMALVSQADQMNARRRSERELGPP